MSWTPEDPTGQSNPQPPVNPHTGTGHAGGNQGQSPNPAQEPCPPPQTRHPVTGQCRYPGDMPCPAGQCKDTVSGICRSPGKNEKIRESDGSEVRGLCRQRDGGGAGGAGGAGGGGGGAAAGKPGGAGGAGGAGGGAGRPCPPGVAPAVCAILGFGEPLNSKLGDTLSKMLDGPSRFTDPTVARLQAASLETNRAQETQQIDSANSDAAARGMYRSGVAADEVGQIRRNTANQIASDSRTVQLEKVKADWEDKLAAIDRSQKWIESYRQAALAADQTQAEREKTEATIKLGYAQIDNAMKMLTKQLSSNESLMRMQLSSAEWRTIFGASQGYY